MFLSTGYSLLRAEGFSCSLGILYGGLGISKLKFLIKKIEIKFPAINFFQFSVIKTWIRIRNLDPQLEKMLDPDPDSGSAIRKNAGSGSGYALNQCGSETLATTSTAIYPCFYVEFTGFCCSCTLLFCSAILVPHLVKNFVSLSPSNSPFSICDTSPFFPFRSFYSLTI